MDHRPVSYPNNTWKSLYLDPYCCGAMPMMVPNGHAAMQLQECPGRPLVARGPCLQHEGAPVNATDQH